MSNRALLTAYAVWMSVLTAAFYLVPSWHIGTWGLITLSSALAILYGAHRYKPRWRAPWRWLAAGVLCFGAGDTAYNVIVRFGGDTNPFPSVADLLYLAMYALTAVGIVGLSRAGAASRNRAVALDAMIFTVGVGMLCWMFLIAPRLADSGHSLLERAISVAYPLGDVLLVAVAMRLVFVARATPTVLLLAVGAFGTLVADVLYGLIQVNAEWSVGGPVDLGWIVFYACWGAAALHPSMRQLTEPRVVRPRDMGAAHQILLSLFLLIPLTVLFFVSARGYGVYPVVIDVFVVVIFVLVLVRLFGVINSYRGSILRGRGLREANAALLSATDTAGVADALRTATAQLLPEGTPHHVLVIMNDGTVPELFEGRPAVGLRLCYTRTLHIALAGQLGGFEIALVCPLALADRPSGDPHIGVVLIAADEVSLGYLQTPMELLAAQAALALERISLGGEIARRNSEQYFRTLVQNTTDVILIIEPDGRRIRYASPSARTVLGLEATGHDLGALLGLTPDCLAKLARGDQVLEWAIVRHGGEEVQLEISGRDLRDDATVGGLVLTIRDVTDQRRLREELEHQAFHDGLTGLANRTLFTERIRDTLARVRSSGGVLGVMFLDLDDFKVVNDTFGHEYGDLLLHAVSRRLTGVLRPADTAARLGGDEFAVLIAGVADAAGVEAVAERIVSVLSEPFAISDRTVSGLASIGVVVGDGSQASEELLRQADLALYVAKNAGKGQWRRYEPTLHTEMVHRLELRAALDQAIAHGDLRLEFQPIVALHSGRTAGFEALVRWEHPTRGTLRPDQFIDVAEESGLIVPMGEWVMRSALAAAAGWQSACADECPYVSINVSVRQFRAPGFVASVKAGLRAAGLPPDRLMVEITESLLLRDDDAVWDDLVELRRLGVRVAIDDFGTGYSSLSYLRHVPLDALKIDRLFTSTIATSAKQAALVDGIVRLAQTLGLDVIAEGIERESERDLLSRFGCQYGQGFLYARPLGPAETLAWLSPPAALPLGLLPADPVPARPSS